MQSYKNIPLGLSYDDVLLIPQISNVESRSDVDLSTQITPRIKLNIPLISINMTDVTGVEMAIALGKLGGIGFLPRFETPENQAEMVKDVKKQNVVVGAAVGCKEGYLERAEMLANAGVDILTLDVAHGGMIQAIEATTKLKRMFGTKCDIISGVIGTYETAYALFKAGADSVRVGVGPGTICITRIQTGVGIPQITGVMEAYRAAKHFNKTVLCDGGTKNSGDMSDEQKQKMQEMIEKEKYCIDILQQSSAAKNALSGIEDLVLENHLSTHVIEQIQSGKELKAAKEVLAIYKLSKKK